MPTFLIATFYKFMTLSDPAALKVALLDICTRNSVKGTFLLATEGINATIAGTSEAVNKVLAFLRNDTRFTDLQHKESWTKIAPFHRLKIHIKLEIVKMGIANIQPDQMAGQYVQAQDWNALITDPDVIVIDARNDFEVAIGTFQGAINPHTKTFSELPAWLRQETQLGKKPKVAMFCTGGIRCEKSTAFLCNEGFQDVYHLDGGILKYLEVIPENQSLWQGECFVFDERVAVTHGLDVGTHELCRACRYPVSPTDQTSVWFVRGISCPHCHTRQTPTKTRALTERRHQVELAEQRNQIHVGARYESKPKLNQKIKS